MSRPARPPHAPAAAALAGAARGGAVLAVGAPPLSLVERVLALRGPHGYRPPLYIIEPDPDALAAWVSRLPERSIPAGGRVRLFGGPRAWEAYRRFRVAHLARAEPTHVVRPPGPAPPSERACRERVQAAVTRRREILYRRQSRFYRGRDAAWWAGRFRRGLARGATLRVLGLTTRYSTFVRHAAADLARAFRARGCAFDLVQEPDESSADVDVWTAMAGRGYDLVVLQNILRRELAGRIHPGVPCAVWLQDHVAGALAPEAGRSVGPLERVICHRPALFAARGGYPPARLLASSNLTGLHRLEGPPPSAADLAPYRCDVSYVSHAAQPAERLAADLAAPRGPAFASYLAEIVFGLRQGLERRGWLSLTERLEVMERAEAAGTLHLARHERAAGILPIVESLYDRLLRHQTLGWVSAWAARRGRSLRLYGRGWEQHPTLAAHACGEIEHGEPLRRLCRGSRVNLQVNGYASLHQRLLDALAAGGFVLCRYNPSDFIAAPMRAMRAWIKRAGVRSLEDLLRRAARSGVAADFVGSFDRLGLMRIAAADDPLRRREIYLLRAQFDHPPALLTDGALFRALREATGAPRRAAADLPGFPRIVFDTPAALEALLERYVDDEAARRAVAAPMREAVITHDSYDVLVERILRSFAAVR